MGRAIVRKPKLLLMGQPFSNLDARMRIKIRQGIAKLHRRPGTSILYVTHDQMEAMTLGTRIVVMKDGLIQQLPVFSDSCKFSSGSICRDESNGRSPTGIRAFLSALPF